MQSSGMALWFLGLCDLLQRNEKDTCLKNHVPRFEHGFLGMSFADGDTFTKAQKSERYKQPYVYKVA